MYRALSRRYGWTPAEIAGLTWAQITMYLTDDTEQKLDDGRRLMQFTGPNAMQEYQAWRQAKFGGK